TGFSATASQNTVKFNGTAATVNSATSTQLVSTVPTGATTGTISVTAPAGAATSNSAFTVGTASGAPTITSFTPTIALPGTPVTITGTNFDPSTNNDNLAVNITRTYPSSATVTTITTSIPGVSATGHIKVTTSAGTVVSSGYLFVPPTPYTVA